jgi:plasmid stabilization system protein ParE
MATRRSVERRPRARTDVIEQAIYLGEEATEEVALRFIDAVHAAFGRLADTPDVGSSSTPTGGHLDIFHRTNLRAQ